MTTTPFLGCKISLISKSEIRYEGILYTIDPKESTIALAKVRSFGTEDRTAERQVPPRDEIFEYIIFRAGDIKDLIVDDPPAAIAPGLADPAIIQAHSTSTSAGATFPSTTFPQMSNTSITSNAGQRSNIPAFSGSGQSAINSLTMSANVKSNQSVDSRSQNSTPTPNQMHRNSPHNDMNSGPNAKNMPNKENYRKPTDRGGQFNRRGSGGGFGGQQNYPQKRDQQNYQQRQSHPNNKSGGGGGGGRFGGSGHYNQHRQYNNYSQPNAGGRRPPNRGQPQRGLPHRNQANRVPKEPLKFDGDFDFEEANSAFKQLEEKLTNLKIDGTANSDSPPDPEKQTNDTEASTNGVKDLAETEPFYNKAKSFFDNISCEALEREKGNVQRVDWKAERKLNSETFGVPLSYRFRGFGRGRGGYNNRGYHSQGYRRGGGGYSRGGGGDSRRFNGPQRTTRTN